MVKCENRAETLQITRINTDSVSKQIYNLIKNDILDRRLKPGEKIDTRKIAEDNGISVMPVRSALQQLATNGLVVDRERVGFYVRKLSNEEIRWIMEMRTMYEMHCLRYHLPAIDKKYVADLLRRLNEPIQKKELDDLDGEMHGLIIAASENTFLINQYNNLNALFALIIRIGREETPQTAKKEHIAILDAIFNDRTEEAVQLLQAHLNRACEEVTGIYSSST